MNILAAPIDDGACGLYRVKQPLEKLQQYYPDIKYDILRANHTEKVIWEGLKMSDILIVRQDKSHFISHVRQAQIISIKNGQKLPLKIIFDHDDNLFDINPFSLSYASSGLKEVKLKDVMDDSWFEEHPKDSDKYLWENGENEFDINRNRRKADQLIKNLKSVDLITAPNQKLCDLYAMMSGNSNTAVLPNCLDFSQWLKDVSIRKNGVRIGWHGGSSHYEDYMMIRDDILRFVEREGIEYVHIGQAFQDMNRLSGHVEFSDWVETPAHPYRMALMNLDVAVIPLTKHEFNYYKSDIKWVEFSALEIPCVVSNVEPYNLVIEHGVTGYLFDTNEEMDYYLTELVRNTRLRQKIGKNAYEWVYENRNADKQAHLWKEAYNALLD